MIGRSIGAAAVLVLLARPAGADTPIRVGDHPGFGRVVLDLPSRIPFETVREGDRLLLVLKGAGPVQAPSRMPRNVAAIQGGIDSATILLTPGTEPRIARLGERLVIDAFDRPPNARPSPAPTPRPRPPVAAEPPAQRVPVAEAPLPTPEPAASPVPPAMPPPPPSPEPAAPPTPRPSARPPPRPLCRHR